MTTEPEGPGAWLEILVTDTAGRPVEGAAATLDGKDVPLGEVLATSAGSHTVTAEASGGGFAPDVRRIELEEGGARSVVLTLAPPGTRTIETSEGPWHVEPEPGVLLIAARGAEAASLVAALREAGIDAAESTEWTDHSGPRDHVVAEISLPGAGEEAEFVARSQEVAERLGLAATPLLPLRRGERRHAAIGTRIVAEMAAGAGPGEVLQLEAAAGLAVERTFGRDDAFVVLTGAGVPSFDLIERARELARSPLVLSAHPDLHAWVRTDAANDPLWAQLDHLSIIRCEEAWSAPGAPWGGSSAVVLGVIDPQGVHGGHEDLSGLLPDGLPKLADSVDAAVVPARRPFTFERGSHGTQVAGTATALAGNALGLAGVAPGCRLLGLRTPGVIGVIEMRDMLVWAAGLEVPPPFHKVGRPLAPVDVLCCAWGVSLPMFPFLDDAIRWVTTDGRGGRGTVLVCSAGDMGHERFAPLRTVAAHPSVIAVGASVSRRRGGVIRSVDPPPGQAPVQGGVEVNPAEDTRALYSPVGLELDVVAPSNPAFPPDADDPPVEGVWSATGVAPWYMREFGGTSHAAPVVAGIAALVLSAAPGLTAGEVAEVIRSTAVVIDPGAGGAGSWFDRGGRPFSRWYGFGRVDARAAVEAAVAGAVPGSPVPEPAVPQGGVVVTGVRGGRNGETCRLYTSPLLDEWIEYRRDDVLAEFGGGGGMPTQVVLTRRARLVSVRRRKAGVRRRG